jgi:hypothetical protein
LRMKRIVILIDGTWNKQAVKGNTNVAKLDPLIKRRVPAERSKRDFTMRASVPAAVSSSAYWD